MKIQRCPAPPSPHFPHPSMPYVQEYVPGQVVCSWCGTEFIEVEVESESAVTEATPPFASSIDKMVRNDLTENSMSHSKPTCPVSGDVLKAAYTEGTSVAVTVRLQNVSMQPVRAGIWLANALGDSGNEHRIDLAAGDTTQKVLELHRQQNSSDVVALRVRPAESESAFFEASFTTERKDDSGNISFTQNIDYGESVVTRPTINVNTDFAADILTLPSSAFQWRGPKQKVESDHAVHLPQDAHRRILQARTTKPQDPYATDPELIHSRPPRLTLRHESSGDGCQWRTHLFAGDELFLGRAYYNKTSKQWYERPLQITDVNQPYTDELDDDGNVLLDEQGKKRRVRNTISNPYPPIDITLATRVGAEDYTYISGYACRLRADRHEMRIESLSANKSCFHPPPGPDGRVGPECTVTFGVGIPPYHGFSRERRLQLQLTRRLCPVRQSHYQQFAADYELPPFRCDVIPASIAIDRTDDVEENYILMNPATLVGSGEHCGWQLSGDGIQSSHACIVWLGEAFWIEPRHRNAVVEVDGCRLQLHQLHRLSPGTHLRLGRRQFTVADGFNQHIVHCGRCALAIPPKHPV